MVSVLVDQLVWDLTDELNYLRDVRMIFLLMVLSPTRAVKMRLTKFCSAFFSPAELIFLVVHSVIYFGSHIDPPMLFLFIF